MKASAFRLVLVSFFLLAAALPNSTLADGMVIPERAYTLPKIPDQQALIHYAQGVETLVIQTSFVGQGTNFAWIVPLPAEAKIRAVSTGLFPTLQTIFQPRIIVSVRHWWLLLPAAAFLVWLGHVFRRGERVAAMFMVGLVLIGLLLFLPALTLASKSRALAGASDSARATVQVLNRQAAGLFDVTTLKAANAAELLAWLNENSYSTPTNIAPVLSDYIRDGWVFAAARLNCQPGGAEARATHPLAFSFKTERPVYPLRLTAKGTDSCHIDLFVFGPARAKASGFEVQRCEAPQYPKGEPRPNLEPGPLSIRHAELANLVGGAPVATKLSGVLNAWDMERDLYLTWKTYLPSGQKVYAFNAAWILSGNVAAISFMALVAVWWCFCETRFDRARRIHEKGHWCGITALTAGLICFLTLPKINASSYRTVRSRFSFQHMNCIELATALYEELPDSKLLTNQTPERVLAPVEWDALLEGISRKYQGDWSYSERYCDPLTNFFTNERIRLEASPGNFILRPAKVPAGSQPDPDRWRFSRTGPINSPRCELIWHDFDGAESLSVPVPPFGQR